MRARRNAVARRRDAALDKARRTIESAGWGVTVANPLGTQRFVACKPLNEEDGSTTKLFESAFTLEDLARVVLRREREESSKSGRRS